MGDTPDPDTSEPAPLSAISHDLRQPLHALLLYLEALDRRVEREDARDILNKARSAAEAMSDQLAALSLHNRLAKHEVKAHSQLTRTQEIAAAALAPYAPSLVTSELRDTQTEIETDPDLLVQALRAVIENAIRQGGAALEVRREGETFLFRVRDSGSGLDEGERVHIFLPFVKGNAAGAGLGLGLSNAVGLARLLGATLEADADQSQGGAFSLRCPISSGR